MITERPVVLDTCILINLLATDRVEEILRVVAPQCLVCSAVSKESLYLRPLQPDAQAEAIDLSLLFEARILAPCDTEAASEEELYVNYASELDDGEAMSLAIAQARTFVLGTDDRKTRRLIRENISRLSIVSIVEIIHAWASEVQPSEVSATVRAIQARARFRPQDSDQLAP